MNLFVKQAVRDLLPPIMLRWLKRRDTDNDAWGRARFGFSGLWLPGGRQFHFRPTAADRGVCRQIFLDREYSFAGLARSAELLRFYTTCDRPLIVDAGANIGAASIWFALTYPKATIIAIEPDRANFELLKLNAIEFPSVLPFNAAITSTTGTLYLCDPGQGAWAYRTASQPSDHSYPVPAITIEELLGGVADRTPFIFKIDIEGAESDLFSRHSNEFDRFPIVAIELHDWMFPRKANSRNFLRWHTEKCRDFVFRGENAFSIATEINAT
jgi:FkbM family methyltransferase